MVKNDDRRLRQILKQLKITDPIASIAYIGLFNYPTLLFVNLYLAGLNGRTN